MKHQYTEINQNAYKFLVFQARWHCPPDGHVEALENVAMDQSASPTPTLKRAHAKRLRELYRSAGWPYQDVIEIELLAAGLLERVPDAKGVECMRVTDAGIQYLAHAAQSNRNSLSAHNHLVDQVAHAMLRDGRIVWKGLSLRASLPQKDEVPTRWRICMPDVFSIRNTTVQGYLEPIVHEIKVSRADVLGDLKNKDKRDAYLAIGGQCWYVLGCNAKGKPIAEADEIPLECGVMLFDGQRLDVARSAPKRPVAELPFSVWMALAKATPLRTEICLMKDDLGAGEQDFVGNLGHGKVN